MRLKIFVVAFILCCYPNFLYASYDEGPKNLLVSEEVKNIPIIDKDGKSINISMTASQTIKDGNQLIFCNYATLYLMDLTTGITKVLEKPKNVEVWVPTGVKWCPDNKRLYLANYLGKDILVLKFDEQDQLSLVKRYVDEELIGPENIDVIEKGKEFGENLINAKTTEEQQKAAKLFLQTVEKDSLLYFCEISIASMVVYGFIEENKK